MMSISKDLFLSVISMDAYNRGYNAGLKIDGDAVGHARIINQDNSESAQNVGFYALSYELQADSDTDLRKGATVISYRGTDDDLDKRYGWTLGAGVDTAPQAQLALQFYASVVGLSQQNTDGYNHVFDDVDSNVLVTGHSLGGGLAGFVSWIAGVEGVGVDHMPFGIGALAAIAKELEIRLGDGFNPSTDAITNELLEKAGINVPDFEKFKGIFVEGEVNAGLRDGSIAIELGSLLSAIPILGPFAFFLGLHIGTGQIFVESKVKKAELSTFDWDIPADTPFSTPRHSAALAVILEYAKDHPSWRGVSKELLSALFDEAFAESIGFSDVGGTSSASEKLKTIIAYSVLDEGERPYGDVAVRAMFNDADRLGSISTKLSDELKVILSETIVHFAGTLALKDVQWLNDGQKLGVESWGELDVDGLRNSFGITSLSSDSSVLTVDAGLLDQRIFKDGVFLYNNKGISDYSGVNIALAAPRADDYLNKAGFSWNDINRYNFAVDASATSYTISNPIRTTVSADFLGIFVVHANDSAQPTTVNGSDSNDWIFAGNATQDVILFGGSGKDILIGGQGFDILRGGIDDDVLAGGMGSDSYYWNFYDGADYIMESGGRNIVYADFSGSGLHESDVIKTVLNGGITVTYTFLGETKIAFTIENTALFGSLDDLRLTGLLPDAEIPVTVTDFLPTDGADIIKFDDGDTDVSNFWNFIQPGDWTSGEPFRGEAYAVIRHDQYYWSGYGTVNRYFFSNPNHPETVRVLAFDQSGKLLPHSDLGWYNSIFDVGTGPGNDVIDAGQGQNRIAGGQGNDTIYMGTDGGAASGGDGNDYIEGNGYLFGGSGRNVLVGSGKAVLVSEGYDTLIGAASKTGVPSGDIAYFGALGYVTGDIGAVTFVDLASGTATRRLEVFDNAGSHIVEQTTRLIGINNVVASGKVFGSAGNDTLIGAGELTGRDGDDVLIAGNPWVLGNLAALQSDPNNLRDGLPSTGQLFTLPFWLNGSVPAVDLDVTPFTISDVQYGAKFSDSDFELGKGNILDGGKGNDTLIGAGVLKGGDGSDTLAGLGEIDGGVGNDVLFGNGRLSGGVGNDALYGIGTLLGGDGNDTIVSGSVPFIASNPRQIDSAALRYGSAEGSVIDASAGNDTIRANSSGLDRIDGGAGEDTVLYDTFHNLRDASFSFFSLSNGARLIFDDGGAYGQDYITNVEWLVIGTVKKSVDEWFKNAEAAIAVGAEKVDLSGNTVGTKIISLDTETVSEVIGTSGNDIFIGDWGRDIADGGNGDDTLDGRRGDDTLSGGKGRDRIVGGIGKDIINGGDGDDEIRIESNADGVDAVDGGAGADYLYLSRQASQFGFSFSIANSSLKQTLSDGTTIVGIERMSFYGGNANDTVVGGSLDDVLYGYGGVDYLSGGAGKDTLAGGDGNDVLNGGDGDDAVYGGIGDDKLTGDAGDDTIEGGFGDDDIKGGDGSDIIKVYYDAGNDAIDGGNGSDYLFLSRYGSNASYNLSIATPSVKQTLADGTTIVNVERLEFYGGLKADTVTGGALDDILYGNAGTDILIGGGGNDKIYGGQGNDTVQGGIGDDSLYAYADEGNDSIDGGAGADTLLLSRYGLSNAYTLSIADPSVKQTLIDGTTVVNIERLEYYGGKLADTVTGGALADILYGNEGNDVLKGGGGNDEFFGADGDDYFEGGAGNDKIEGNAGKDTAFFDGLKSQYKITGNANGSFTVSLLSAPSSDTDTLTNVETIRFRDAVAELKTGGVVLFDKNPTSIALTATTVKENAVIGTTVGTFSAVDPEGKALTYTLTDNADGVFALSGTKLVTAKAIDYEKLRLDTVTVEVTDASGLKSSKTFTITVTDVNEAPASLALSASTVKENAPIGTLVGNLSAVDPEGKALTYKLTDTAGGLFKLAGTQLVTAKAADYETLKLDTVTVEVSDATGLKSTKTFTIGITDVNEVPASLALSASTVKENATIGTLVGNLSALDPEGKALTYKLTDTADGMFKLTGTQLVTAKAIDYEKLQSDTITVEVSDATGLKSTKTFAIAVTDVLESINGTAKAETLNGGIGADKISGLAGNDILYGNGGADFLIGGTGFDDLYGGAGKDTFVFSAASDIGNTKTGSDTIYDFLLSEGDIIDLSGMDANGGATGNQAFSFIGLAGFSGKAGQLRYEKEASDTYIYGDLNGDRKSDFTLHLDDAITLKDTSFVL